MSEKVLVTPAELSDMTASEAVVVIDTRAPVAYAAGHLPGAVNIHDIFTYLAMSTPEGVAAMRDKFAETFGVSRAKRRRSSMSSRWIPASVNRAVAMFCCDTSAIRRSRSFMVATLHG